MINHITFLYLGHYHSTSMDTRCHRFCYRQSREQTNATPFSGKPLQLVFFDMDGVLTAIYSSWKLVHDYFHTSNEKSVKDYLKGTIDDMEFIRRDVALWKNHGEYVHHTVIENILNDVPYMKGAESCISFLKQHGIKTAIVSAGLDVLAERVAKDLGIDYVFANGCKVDAQGRLNGDGILGVQLKYKDKNVKDLANQLGIPLEQCAAVGNSCFDVPMFESCGLGIAFNPADDCVREAADVVVEGTDLSNVIPVVKTYL